MSNYQQILVSPTLKAKGHLSLWCDLSTHTHCNLNVKPCLYKCVCECILSQCIKPRHAECNQDLTQCDMMSRDLVDIFQELIMLYIYCHYNSCHL